MACYASNKTREKEVLPFHSKEGIEDGGEKVGKKSRARQKGSGEKVGKASKGCGQKGGSCQSACL